MDFRVIVFCLGILLLVGLVRNTLLYVQKRKGKKQ